MKYDPKTIGFFQAVGLAFYVVCFASLVFTVPQFVGDVISPGPIFGITIFLLAFIISATICGSLMFGYPFVLFNEGRKKEVLHVVMWCVGWLLLIFLAIFTITIVMNRVIIPEQAIEIQAR